MHPCKPWLVLLATLLFPRFASAQPQPPVCVSLCDLLKNPKAYDGELVLVRGRSNLEFQDFTIYDLQYNYSPDIWLTFGGDVATPTMSMRGDTKRHSGKNIYFAGAEHPLLKHASFDEFVKHVTAREKRRPAYRVTASLTGMFFAQNPKLEPQLGIHMPGYGHMGCCWLLIIRGFSNVEAKLITRDEYNEKWSKRRDQATTP